MHIVAMFLETARMLPARRHPCAAAAVCPSYLISAGREDIARLLLAVREIAFQESSTKCCARRDDRAFG